MQPSTADEARPRLPPSVTHFGLNTIAIAVVIGVLYAIRAKALRVHDPVLAVCAAYVVPVVLFDLLILRVHRRATTGIDWDKPFTPDAARIATKLLGLAVTLAPFAIAYWAFPEYQGSFYDPFYGLLRRFWAGLLLSAVLYMVTLDGSLREPRDVYWRLGRVFLGRWRDADRAEIGNHYRGWLIKAYFFALFWVWLSGSTNNILNADLTNASWSNLRAYDLAYDFIFFIDLLLATVGYAMTYRVLDTHIRSAEPTMLGWTVALFCYEPFFRGLFEKQYIRYGGNSFGSWLAPYPTLRWAWAAVIVLLILVYVLATVAFGVRFSNLTHRGILTNGPYRFTKHPAYVAKNLSWWLASVPFVVSDSVPNAIKRSLLLGVLNFIYFMRAKTEERHLSHDPTYVEYALWMNEHGALRFLNRVPFLEFKAPHGKNEPGDG
ncbi:MAG: isoprenylcysteine carboxylmethyltransferase family protein [Polyangiaceae bacterium]